MVPAIAFAVLAGLLMVFRAGLALGAPWGRLAWGGQHVGVLPAGYRIGSALSVPFYAVVVTVLLDRASVIALYPDGFSAVAAWVMFAVLALGVVPNLFSRSRPERYVMTPVALALAVLALLIATAEPDGRALAGIMRGDGPGAAY